MPGPEPTPIVVTTRQREILERLARRETIPQRLLRRCNVVLEAADGANNTTVGRRLRILRSTALTWRKRWAEAAPALVLAEEERIDD